MYFRSANEAFCRILGYSEDELQTRSFRDITYTEDVEISNKEMEELICGSILYFSQEKRYVRKDGNIIDGKVVVSAIRDSDGKPVLFVAELEDITQQKQSEAELRATFNVLERVGEGIDAGLAVIGKDYRVVWANKRLRDLGVAPNKKCYETFNHSKTVCVDCGAKIIFEQNVSLDVHEYKTTNPQGEIIWIELRVTPLKDKDGNVTAALELAVPITERKKAEGEVPSMAMFPLENPNPVFRVAKDGTVLFANAAAEKVLSALASGVGKLAPERGRRWIFDVLKSGLTKEHEIEFENRVLSFVFSPVVEEGYVNLYGRDITESKKAEEELRNSEAKLRGIVDCSTDQIFLIDKNLNYLMVNNALAAVLGKVPKEIIGRSIGEVYGLETATQFSENIKTVFETGKSMFLEEKMVAQGQELFISTSLNPIKENGGDVKAVTGIVRDITERKHLESNLLKSKAMLNEIEKTGKIGGPWIISYQEDDGCLRLENK